MCEFIAISLRRWISRFSSSLLGISGCCISAPTSIFNGQARRGNHGPCARACVASPIVYNSRVNCDTLPTASHRPCIYFVVVISGEECVHVTWAYLHGEALFWFVAFTAIICVRARAHYIYSSTQISLYRQTMETFGKQRNSLSLSGLLLILLSRYSLLRVGDVRKKEENIV